MLTDGSGRLLLLFIHQIAIYTHISSTECLTVFRIFAYKAVEKAAYGLDCKYLHIGIHTIQLKKYTESIKDYCKLKKIMKCKASKFKNNTKINLVYQLSMYEDN